MDGNKLAGGIIKFAQENILRKLIDSYKFPLDIDSVLKTPILEG